MNGQIDAPTEKFAVVWAVDVHLETGFFSEDAGLPVLVEMLGLNHAHRLCFHGLKTEGDDVIHALDNRAALARRGTPAGPNFTGMSSPSPPKWSPMKNPFRLKRYQIRRKCPDTTLLEGEAVLKHDHGPAGSTRRVRAG